MSKQSVDVVIVGGGQAGLAISYCLTEQGRPHIMLEQSARRRELAKQTLGLATPDRPELDVPAARGCNTRAPPPTVS